MLSFLQNVSFTQGTLESWRNGTLSLEERPSQRKQLLYVYKEHKLLSMLSKENPVVVK